MTQFGVWRSEDLWEMEANMEDGIATLEDLIDCLEDAIADAVFLERHFQSCDGMTNALEELKADAGAQLEELRDVKGDVETELSMRGELQT